MKFSSGKIVGLVLVVALGLALAGYIFDEMSISALNRQLSIAQGQNSKFAADLQASKDQLNTVQTQANGLATQVALLSTQLDDPAAVKWNQEVVSFLSEYDGARVEYLLITPLRLSAEKHALVVYLHSMGAGPDEVLKQAAGEEPLVSVLIRHEAIIASPVYRGDSWLNPAAASDVSQMIRALKTRFPLGGLIVSGVSMGGTSALMYPLLAPKDIQVNGIVAGVFASDVEVLWSEGKNVQVRDSLVKAYGGTPDEKRAVYGERSVMRNLLQIPATLPVALYASYSDSMIPLGQQTRLRDALAARGNPMLFVTIPGDHQSASLDEGFSFVLDRIAGR